MRIPISMNLGNFIRELPKFFQNSDAFVTELIQNSYRAGATRIDIRCTAKTFAISDNGHGIKDMRDIFTLAQSGWEKDSVAKLDPAGMGIFSAFLTADKVTVTTWRTEDGKKTAQHSSFTKERILAGHPINVSEVNGDYNGVSGTEIMLFNSFVVKDIQKNCDKHGKYLTENIDGGPLSIVFNEKAIEACDFLCPTDGIKFKANISAGELILMGYESINNVALFCGQIINLTGISPDMYFRLKVKPGGLTLRLPDRTGFVMDEKYKTMLREIKEAKRGYLWAQDAISVQDAKEYFPSRAADLVPLGLGVAPFNIDFEVLSLSVSYDRGGITNHKLSKTIAASNILKYDIIISDDYLSDNNHHIKVLSAMDSLADGIIGVCNESVFGFSQHPELLKRKRTLDDFRIKITKKGKTVKSKNGYVSFSHASAVLIDTKTDKQYPIKGLILDSADFNDYASFYWSGDERLSDMGYNKIISEAYKVCQLTYCHCGDDENRDNPYGDDFDVQYDRLIKEIFAPFCTLASDIIHDIQHAIRARYNLDDVADIDAAEIKIKNGNVLFTAHGKKYKYVFDGREITRPKKT